MAFFTQPDSDFDSNCNSKKLQWMAIKDSALCEYVVSYSLNGIGVGVKTVSGGLKAVLKVCLHVNFLSLCPLTFLLSSE